MVRPHQTSSNDCDEGTTEQVRVVRQHRTSSNDCDEGGNRTTGQVRVSSGWFDHTEPPRTTVMKGEAGFLGGSTTPNLLDPL